MVGIERRPRDWSGISNLRWLDLGREAEDAVRVITNRPMFELALGCIDMQLFALKRVKACNGSFQHLMGEIVLRKSIDEVHNLLQSGARRFWHSSSHNGIMLL